MAAGRKAVSMSAAWQQRRRALLLQPFHACQPPEQAAFPPRSATAPCRRSHPRRFPRPAAGGVQGRRRAERRSDHRPVPARARGAGPARRRPVPHPLLRARHHGCAGGPRLGRSGSACCRAASTLPPACCMCCAGSCAHPTPPHPTAHHPPPRRQCWSWASCRTRPSCSGTRRGRWASPTGCCRCRRRTGWWRRCRRVGVGGWVGGLRETATWASRSAVGTWHRGCPPRAPLAAARCAPQVPAGEVLDMLSVVLRPAPADPATTCPAGTYAASEDGVQRCTACSPGSYAFLSGTATCKPCAPGRAAGSAGATACRTCPAGSFSSADGRECQRCPDGAPQGAGGKVLWCCGWCACHTPSCRRPTAPTRPPHPRHCPHAGTYSALPGAWEPAQCLSPDQRRRRQEDQALNVQMLRSGLRAGRRRLWRQGAVCPQSAWQWEVPQAGSGSTPSCCCAGQAPSAPHCPHPTCTAAS